MKSTVNEPCRPHFQVMFSENYLVVLKGRIDTYNRHRLFMGFDWKANVLNNSPLRSWSNQRNVTQKAVFLGFYFYPGTSIKAAYRTVLSPAIGKFKRQWINRNRLRMMRKSRFTRNEMKTFQVEITKLRIIRQIWATLKLEANESAGEATRSSSFRELTSVLQQSWPLQIAISYKKLKSQRIWKRSWWKTWLNTVRLISFIYYYFFFFLVFFWILMRLHLGV